jgi:hypothetical protein
MRMHRRLQSMIGFALFVLLVSGSPFGGIAQAAQSQPKTGETLTNSSTTLGSLLNPDGTLNLTSGFNGSLDARGWQMS